MIISAAKICLLFGLLVHQTLQPVFAQQQPPVGNLAMIKDAASEIAAGKLDHAEEELQFVLRSTPNEFHALNLLAIVRAQQKREEEAERLFLQVIALQPEYAGAHAGLGLLYVQMGTSDLAIPQLEEALRMDTGRSDVQAALTTIWRGQAHAAVVQGELEKALALLLEARKLSPSDPDVQYDFGIVALKMSLFSDAVDGFRQTLKLRVNDPQALYGLGRAQMSLAKFEDAHTTFEQYLKLRPEDPSGHYAQGMVLQALQQSSEARQEFERSIQIKPQQTESYLQIGLIDLDAGNLKEAEEQFTRVLQRDSHHPRGLAGMGRVKFQEKDYTNAAGSLTNAIAIDPKLREAHYYLGLTDARLGRKEESEKELQIASELEHAEAEQQRNRLKIVDTDQVQVPSQ